jgi:hypothetical protein
MLSCWTNWSGSDGVCSMMIETFVGACVGHMIGEYVLQPEWMLSQKRVFLVGALAASLGHTAVWTACVWGCSPGLAPGALLVLSGVHHVVDCSPVSGWLMRLTQVQSMARSMEMAMGEEMPQLVASVQFALAAASESMFNLALHVGLIYAVLRLMP